MIYAHVKDGIVDAVGQPPEFAHDGERWWDLRELDPEALAATDWSTVTETDRPEDTATTTFVPTYTVEGDSIVQSWVERPDAARIDYHPNGQLRALWDYATRKFTQYDTAGEPVPGSERDFDETETAIADAFIAGQTAATNKSSLETNLEADIAWLQTQIAKTNSVLNSEFNNNPAAFLKPFMRVVRRGSKMSLRDYSTPD